MFLRFRFVLLAIALPFVFVSCNKEEEEPYDVVIDFQDVEIPNGKFDNNAGLSGYFHKDNVKFQNTQSEGYWYGFAYSQMHDVTTFDYATNEFSAFVPNDSQKNKFMVGYISTWDATSIEIIFNDPVKDLSFDVANNTLAALAMKGEDPNLFARKFEDGDWFTLTITVTSTDGTEIIAINLGEDTKVTNVWNPISVSSNNVTKLDFSLSSSDTGEWGMNTPAYFCIDNIKARTVK